MVEAARKYQRMVQIGTQNRSSPNVMEGMQKLKEGVIGKLYMARGMTYKIRGNLGKHRPGRCPRASTGTPGWGRPRWSSTAASIITAGTGSRTSPAATSPTRRRTTSTSSAGAWAWTPIPNVMMSLGGRYVPAEDDDADTPNTPVLRLPVGRPQRAGHVRDPPLVHQQRGGDARQVSVSRRRFGAWA